MVHGGGSRGGGSQRNTASRGTASNSNTRREGSRNTRTTVTTTVDATTASRGSGGGTRKTSPRPTQSPSRPATTPNGANSNTSTNTTTASRGSGGGTRSVPATNSRRTTNITAGSTNSPNPTTTRNDVHRGSGGGTRPIPSTANTNSRRTTTTPTPPRRAQPTRTRSPTTTSRNTTRGHHYPSSNGTNTRRAINREDPLEEPLIIRPRPEQPEEDEGPNCCHGCACCLCCISSLSFLGFCLVPFLMLYRSVRNTATIPLFLVGAILFGALMMFSGYQQTWILNAGESRQITTSWFTRAIDVQILTPHTTVEVDVYNIHGKCPPLTGPLVKIHEEHELTFGPGDYQYDYFFLNKGSRVEAELTQLQGQQEVYMMKGPDKVAILEEAHHDDPDWLDDLLLTARAKWKTDEYTYQTTARFRADQNDVYVLLYDNAYNQDAHLVLDLWLFLTSYYLNGHTPVCGDLAFHDCAPIRTKRSDCIILDTSSAYGQGEIVTIRISELRNYRSILILSLLPVVLAILWEVYTCCRSIWPWRREEDDVEAPTRDPPTAPQGHQATSTSTPSPTAPPADEDNAIPVASAQLVEDDAGDHASSAAVEPLIPPQDEKN